MYYVLYDAECGLCTRMRTWAMAQEMLVPLEFVALQSPDLRSRFVGIDAYDPEDEVVVIDEHGGVYQGAGAWIMVLYALRDFRSWAFDLSSPHLMPLARRMVHAVSANRLRISRLFGSKVSTTEALRNMSDEVRCVYTPQTPTAKTPAENQGSWQRP